MQSLATDLLEVAETWLSRRGASGLAEASRQLSEAYRAGRSTSAQPLDLRAYLAARLPATLAVAKRVMEEVGECLPGWRPRSFLDLGAGPGTASWAAIGRWPEIDVIHMVENHEGFRALAIELSESARHSVLRKANLLDVDLASATQLPKADLVAAAYSLIELPAQQLPHVAERAWAATNTTLVVIEPGTPAAFARLLAVRRHLIALGATIVAPCPGNVECPLAQPDWCHFVRRLGRSRLHKHAKAASVPYEDEKFCYLVATRTEALAAPARIIRSPRHFKHGVELELCSNLGLKRVLIASRRKSPYRIANRLAWGDAVPQTLCRELDDGS